MGVKLRYFNLRGRGEQIRYVLLAAGAEFEDDRFTIDTWFKEGIKESFPLPFCPLLINEKGETMQQSLAIGAALAQKYGMLGSNPWEMGKICEIAHNYEDQLQAMVKENVLPKQFLGGDPEELKTAWARYMGNQFQKFMQHNEKTLTAGGGTWFVGGKMSWADLTIAEFMQRIEELQPGCLDAFPLCKSLVKRVHELPNIAKYVAQRPKTPF